MKKARFVEKCPNCKSSDITPYVGGQFGTYECKNCGYTGALLMEEKIPVSVPGHYRPGFDSWLAWFYDGSFHIVFFGLSKKLRNLFVDYMPARVKRVLDLATGTGEVALAIKEHLPKAQVFGIDLSNKMLSIARKKARKRGLKVEFRQENMERVRLPARYFDVVTVSFGLHEVPEKIRERVIREAYRLLKKGGRFVVMDFNTPQNIVLRALFSIFLAVFEEDYARTFLSQDLKKKLEAIEFRHVKKRLLYNKLIQVIEGSK